MAFVEVEKTGSKDDIDFSRGGEGGRLQFPLVS